MGPGWTHLLRGRSLLHCSTAQSAKLLVDVGIKNKTIQFNNSMLDQCSLDGSHITEEDYAHAQEILHTKIAMGGLGFVNGSAASNGCSAVAGAFAAIGKTLLQYISKEEFKNSSYAAELRAVGEFLVNSIAPTVSKEFQNTLQNSYDKIVKFVHLIKDEPENIKVVMPKMQHDLTLLLQVEQLNKRIKRGLGDGRLVEETGKLTGSAYNQHRYTDMICNSHPQAGKFLYRIHYRNHSLQKNTVDKTKPTAMLIRLGIPLIKHQEVNCCLKCKETFSHINEHAFLCKKIHTGRHGRTTHLHNAIRDRIVQILIKSGAFVGVKREPSLEDLGRINGGLTENEKLRRREQYAKLQEFLEQRAFRNGGGNLNPPAMCFQMTYGDISYTIRGQNISKTLDVTTSSVHCGTNFDKKNIVPGGVATASEVRKDKKYEKVWNTHKDFITSMGFDLNGGWGKQALDALKELFKKGDHWYSEWHRLYFRKMMVEQVSELLNEKNAELILSLAEKYQPNNLGVVERQDEEIGAVAQDRGMSVNNNNNNLEYIS